MQGLFITFEGGETVGKTTQAERISRVFRDMGRTVVRTREPGGSPLSERLRGLLLAGICGDNAEADAILFAAARAIHVDRTIRPAIDAGHVVVCDRFIDSTRALQGASGLDPAVYEELIREACGDCMPDLTIVLTLPDDVLQRRLDAKGIGMGLDAFESRGREYHREVNRRFAAIAAADPDRCVMVEATGSMDEVTDRIVRALVDRSILTQGVVELQDEGILPGVM